MRDDVYNEEKKPPVPHAPPTDGPNAGEDEDMEAALKRARRHLAASGHIARALAKRKAQEEKPARMQASKIAAKKAAQDKIEAQQARAAR